LRDLADAQQAFDAWRRIYNFERPHQGIGMQVPADRYRPSTRTMPERLPQVDYDEREITRVVPSTKDYIGFKSRLWKVPQAFRGERVAIRPLSADGQYGVFFGAHQIATIDLTHSKSVSDVPNRCQLSPRAKHLSRPSTSWFRERLKTWMPGTRPGMTS